MKYFIGSRGSGISTEIVLQSAKFNIPILITSHSYIDIYNRKAEELQVKYPTYVLLSNMRGYKGDLLIDNNEIVLRQMLKMNYGFEGKVVAIGDTL